jgi:hypothetical protein
MDGVRLNRAHAAEVDGLGRFALLPRSDAESLSRLAAFLTRSEPESEPTISMTDGTHDATCNCFSIRPSYAPLAPEAESNTKRKLTVRQGSEVLTLAFSEIAFTVTSTKPDGTGSSDVQSPRFSCRN